MDPKKILPIGIVTIVILAAVVLWGPMLMQNTPVPTHATVEHYDATGMSFDYPKSYMLESRSDSFEGNPVSVVVLIDAQAAQNIPDYSEGPPTLTVLEVSNPNKIPLSDWVKTKSISNYFLANDKTLSSIAVAGIEGVKYQYSGLYENDAVAVARGDKVYLFFAAWLSADDAIRTDFQNLLKTVTFK